MANNINTEQFFSKLSGNLNERTTRLMAAAAASSMDYGGISQVSRLAGLSRPSIYAGMRELSNSADLPDAPVTRQRQPGGGRKTTIENDQEILDDLNKLIKPYEHGDPESPLKWTSKSLRKISSELKALGHEISHSTVRRLLKHLGYTLQSNKKSHEGSNSPDRNAQFEHISKTAKEFLHEEQPVISVDAKKKELVGNFKNNGKDYRPKGDPEEVNVYDFIDKELGRVTPYGVYDTAGNEGYVGIGISHDTAEFAVETIEKWWLTMGRERYPDAHSLFINADGGGSNGTRNRMWKMKLQKFADKHQINVFVSHFPPGTSKWNKIEHRMFSAISMNWRGKPLTSLEVVVNLIANTTTTTGLKINAEINTSEYRLGEKVQDEEMAKLNIIRHSFHPEWNYAFLCQEL
jgi:transposase